MNVLGAPLSFLVSFEGTFDFSCSGLPVFVLKTAVLSVCPGKLRLKRRCQESLLPADDELAHRLSVSAVPDGQAAFFSVEQTQSSVHIADADTAAVQPAVTGQLVRIREQSPDLLPVRLRQGRYDDVTIYNDSPLDQAFMFKEAGATWIHVVDLDAAKSGVPENHEIIKEISVKTGLKVDTGGGIRNMDTLAKWIEEYGVSRAVLGTAAVKDPEFTRKAIERFGDKVAIGIDAHSGFVSVDGWTSDSELKAVDFALKCKEIGAKTVVFTDIARDGMLTGPAVEATKEMVEATGLDVIASGGIGSDEDVDLIKTSGCAGVIIGKAIYEGKVDLARCLQNV